MHNFQAGGESCRLFQGPLPGKGMIHSRTDGRTDGREPFALGFLCPMSQFREKLAIKYKRERGGGGSGGEGPVYFKCDPEETRSAEQFCFKDTNLYKYQAVPDRRATATQTALLNSDGGDWGGGRGWGASASVMYREREMRKEDAAASPLQTLHSGSEMSSQEEEGGHFFFLLFFFSFFFPNTRFYIETHSI